MKTKLLFLTSLLALIFINFSPVLAFEATGNICKDHPESSICNEVSNNNGKDPIAGPDGILAKAARILSYIVGVGAVLMVIFGGFRFVKSGGDSTKVSEARRTIIYSLVAILVVVFADVILSFATGRIF